MKFKELNARAEKLARKSDKGKKIKPKILATLQQLLSEKKASYKKKLEVTTDPEKRQKLELRLKVVDAHIQKAENI